MEEAPKKDTNDKGPKEDKPKREFPIRKDVLIKSGLAALAILLLAAGYYGYLYMSTPEHLRNPEFDHYHFRTQVIVDGQAVDFSQPKFQEDTPDAGSSCSIALNGTPIDFHDQKDQMTHIHWGGMTGGEFLKYFGWNFIGGKNGSLGYRYDQGLTNMHRVGIKGSVLPDIPDGTNFYVYIGDQDEYVQKDWNDFLNMDLKDFFGQQSNAADDVSVFNLFDLFAQKAYAHGGVDDGHEAAEEGDQSALEELNNVIGNVVIFVQAEEPDIRQVQERFSNLVPVEASTCGG